MCVFVCVRARTRRERHIHRVKGGRERQGGKEERDREEERDRDREEEREREMREKRKGGWDERGGGRGDESRKHMPREGKGCCQ